MIDYVIIPRKSEADSMAIKRDEIKAVMPDITNKERTAIYACGIWHSSHLGFEEVMVIIEGQEKP